MNRRVRSVVLGVVAVISAIALASCSSAPTASPASPVSNTGFDVKTNGFSFQNYGNEPGVKNLEPNDLQKIFGDAVCTRTAEGSCILSPSATQWLQVNNDGMSGGHCFGMAAVAWSMFKDSLKPPDFGGANTNALTLSDNTKLQQQIAAAFVTQDTDPTSSTQRSYAPKDLVNALQQGWGEGKGYVLGFFKLVDGKKTAGHGVTPIAVTDLPEGKKAVEIYDNNFPNETKQIVVDPATNTSTYTTAANPGEPEDVYAGSEANPFVLFDAATTLQTQTCPFCLAGASSSPSAGNGVGAADSTAAPGAFNAVYLNQAAAGKGIVLRITDPQGNPLPGLEQSTTLSGLSDQIVSYVPAGQPFKIDIDATKATAAADGNDVTIIGPGYAYSVEKIDMFPGEVDTINFTPASSKLSYTTKAGAAPDILLAFDGEEKSYNLVFGGLELPTGGGTIEASLNQGSQQATVTAPNARSSTVDFVVDMFTDQNESHYESKPVAIKSGQALTVDYGKWAGGTTPVPYEVTK